MRTLAILASGLLGLVLWATPGPARAAGPARGVLLSSTGERALVVHKGEVLVLALPPRFGAATPRGAAAAAPRARLLQRLPAPALVAEPALSSDGSHVALLHAGTSAGGAAELEVRRVGQPRGPRLKLTELIAGQQVNLAISDEGKHVALAQKGRVHVLEVGRPRPRLVYDEPGSYGVSAELAGRGTGLLLVVRVAVPNLLEAQSTHLDLRELRGARARRWKSPAGAAGRWPGMSPRGQLLGLPTADGVEVYAPAADGKLALRVRLASARAAGARFSTDARTVVTYARLDGRTRGRTVHRFAVADGAARGQSQVASVQRSWQALRDDGVLLVLAVETPPPVSTGGAPGCRRPPVAKGHCAVVYEEPELSVELQALTFD